MKQLFIFHIVFLLTGMTFVGCQTSNINQQDASQDDNDIVGNNDSYANIDFSHWKVTLPIDNNGDDKPDEYQPNELVNNGYQNIDALKDFMFDDDSDASIVFYTYPAGATTKNSSYPRTELREQQTPGSNHNNWKLGETGSMQGTLKIDEISKDEATKREYHRSIVMQIHGIISKEDMAAHGFDSNHAPPLLKMIWIDGHIWAYKKHLVDDSTSGLDLYDDSTDTWTDIKHDFGYVGFDKFEIDIKAELGKLTITANGNTHVFEDTSLAKWPFENYFKAGNYLMVKEGDAFAKIKYYNLTVKH